MKLILTLMTLSLLTVACSTPKEKFEDRQAEAREEYNEAMKEAQEDYQEEELEHKKEKAQDMIDDGEAVNVNEDQGKIQVTE